MVHDGDQNKAGGDAGQAAYDYNYPGPPNLPASLSGFVYNGTQNGPMAGVALTLSELSNGQFVAIATTTTAANGSYRFTNLQPGTYEIAEAPPPLPSGYVSESTTSSAGTVNGTTDGSASDEAEEYAVGPFRAGFYDHKVTLQPDGSVAWQKLERRTQRY
jgi:hypothetical protein